MEKDNLQQRIMEMDEEIQLLVGSNQAIAETTFQMVKQLSTMATISIIANTIILFLQNHFNRGATIVPPTVNSAGGWLNRICFSPTRDMSIHACKLLKAPGRVVVVINEGWSGT